MTVRHEDGWVVYPDGTRLRAISGGGGGGKTTVTSTTNIPPKTPEELELLRKQNEFLDLQMSELKRQNSVLEEFFPEQKALFRAQTEAATTFAEAQKAQIGLQSKLIEAAIADLAKTPEEKEIERLSNQRALAILRGEPIPLSAQQRERLDTLFGEAQRTGERDIRQFGEEMAAARGLRLTDTPAAGEVLRQQKELTLGLKSARAGAELNLSQADAAFAESVRQFQAGLKQQAYNNRLALIGGTAPAQSIGAQSPIFATQGPIQAFSAITPLVDVMTGERIAGASRTQKSSFSTQPGALDYIRAISSLAGGIAGGIAASSERFKKDIEPLDRDEYDRARRRLVRETPVTRWKYKWEPDDGRPHVGPILEMSPDEIRASDTHLDLLSYTGTLHAAVKAIDRDVQELQATLRHARRAA